MDTVAIRLPQFGNQDVKTILVADDDKSCRESIQKVLEREGYGVETAADVDSALEALHKRRFDLVVCDYRMPVKTGLEFLMELRQRQLQVPDVMLSADAAPEASALSPSAHLTFWKNRSGCTRLLTAPGRRYEVDQQWY